MTTTAETRRRIAAVAILATARLRRRTDLRLNALKTVRPPACARFTSKIPYFFEAIVESSPDIPSTSSSSLIECPICFEEDECRFDNDLWWRCDATPMNCNYVAHMAVSSCILSPIRALRKYYSIVTRLIAVSGRLLWQEINGRCWSYPVPMPSMRSVRLLPKRIHHFVITV